MKWLREIFRRLWRRLFRKPIPLKTERIEELPDELDPGSVYLVGEGEHLWYAAIVCPCRCRATLYMNLMPHSRPRWEAIEHGDGTITLEPSVWRNKECGSHFFLRRGLVVWCATGSSS